MTKRDRLAYFPFGNRKLGIPEVEFRALYRDFLLTTESGVPREDYAEAVGSALLVLKNHYPDFRLDELVSLAEENSDSHGNT